MKSKPDYSVLKFFILWIWRMATSNPKAILSSPQLLSAGGRCRFFTHSGRFWLILCRWLRQCTMLMKWYIWELEVTIRDEVYTLTVFTQDTQLSDSDPEEVSKRNQPRIVFPVPRWTQERS